MISMKWREDSENSENSALDTFIVSHKIYEKKLFFHRFDFTSSDSPLKQPTGIPYVSAIYYPLEFLESKVTFDFV